MATSKFFIVDNPEDDSDGLIQSREKEIVGRAWNKDGPTNYIDATLEGYWIIPDEDYKLLREYKRNENKRTN